MALNPIYDCAVVGGGIAGLCLSIQLARKGFKVVLLEKGKYPFQKVCGEYISLESFQFLESIGFSVINSDLPIINQLSLSDYKGKSLKFQLPLGGIGISRFKLDHALSILAKKEGVTLIENCKVTDIQFANNQFSISEGINFWLAKVCCGAFGKRSNLDIKWKRIPIKNSNYIGVKYHITGLFPRDEIGLHLFHHGYCGISPIEDNTYCLCYLTTANQLYENHNNIKKMEENLLYSNPQLHRIFINAKFKSERPITISWLNFSSKSKVENHILMIGDSAGMISPLCGNGISMAMHSSLISSKLISNFLFNIISREEMEIQYKLSWLKMFNQRIYSGRIIQYLFQNKKIASFLISSLKPFPALTKQIILSTHGKSF